MRLHVITALVILSGLQVLAPVSRAQPVDGWVPANAPPPAGGPVEIRRMILGTGQPEVPGWEPAQLVSNDMYHAPGYMPGWPTSATIMPRVVDVRCERTADRLRCEGFNWTPAYGRGEYLFFRPIAMGGDASTVPNK